MKDKKGKTVLNAFIKTVNEFNWKQPNKLWFDQGKEFYNKLLQEWLDNNGILMYSTHDDGKSTIVLKALKAKIYKKMTANDSKSYLPYLKRLADKCNNTYYRSINKSY